MPLSQHRPYGRGHVLHALGGGYRCRSRVSRKRVSHFLPSSSHLTQGRFDPEGMIRMLQAALDQAIHDGYAGLWSTGDMTWEMDPDQDFQTLVEYEWRLEVPAGASRDRRHLSVPRRHAPARRFAPGPGHPSWALRERDTPARESRIRQRRAVDRRDCAGSTRRCGPRSTLRRERRKLIRRAGSEVGVNPCAVGYTGRLCFLLLMPSGEAAAGAAA